jgi:hypothetical protein
VLVGARTTERGEVAADRIRNRMPDADLEVATGDLSLMREVRTLAYQIMDGAPRWPDSQRGGSASSRPRPRRSAHLRSRLDPLRRRHHRRTLRSAHRSHVPSNRASLHAAAVDRRAGLCDRIGARHSAIECSCCRVRAPNRCAEVRVLLANYPQARPLPAGACPGSREVLNIGSRGRNPFELPDFDRTRARRCPASTAPEIEGNTDIQRDYIFETRCRRTHQRSAI